ncbi:MAG: hypothetical protein HYU98_04625 [Deltaproteobacteria bacterium]|nr:hypothetical protein [Deltaproteobacteria bacterium]
MARPFYKVETAKLNGADQTTVTFDAAGPGGNECSVTGTHIDRESLSFTFDISTSEIGQFEAQPDAVEWRVRCAGKNDDSSLDSDVDFLMQTYNKKYWTTVFFNDILDVRSLKLPIILGNHPKWERKKTSELPERFASKTSAEKQAVFFDSIDNSWILMEDTSQPADGIPDSMQVSVWQPFYDALFIIPANMLNGAMRLYSSPN